MNTDTPKDPAIRRDIGLLALVAAPFYLNDFLFLGVETAPGWLAADYGAKVLALAILLAVASLRRAAAETLRLHRPVGDSVFLALLCTGFIIFVDHFFRVMVPIEIEGLVLFRYPAVGPGVLYWIDITFGLALTAVSEEIVFRGVFARLAGPWLKTPALIVGVSAAAFALIHWSHGVTTMVVAAIAGVALMALYLRTGSVLPGMAAHYLVNLADFV